VNSLNTFCLAGLFAVVSVQLYLHAVLMGWVP